jgi:hypothetical protein
VCGGREGGRERIGWRPDLKERKKEIKQDLLVDLLLVCYGDIFVCRGLRKDSLDLIVLVRFCGILFCVKRAGRGEAGNGGDPGFDDYGWTVLVFSSLRF